LLRTATGRVAGAQFSTAENRSATITARHVVLASGGSGGLFRVTTNPAQTRGDAIALAFRAGACIADTEFVQFHPTAIDIGCDPAPLATEALRGEGAVLRDRTGRAFMADYHPRADLAPRDAASRAIASEIGAGRGAFLDCRAAVGEQFPTAFPTVFGACINAGIDPRRDMIPVAPAAHYHMGGVSTDIFGATSIDGLSACGECASTGAHGANRLASNSLLEAVVFAHRVATRLKDDTLPELAAAQATQPPLMPAHLIDDLRTRMTRDCGVVRNERGLSNLLDWIVTTRLQVGDANALIAAELIVAPALARRESRGAHHRSDHPFAQHPARRSFLRRGHDGSIIIENAEPQNEPPTTA
jgi:L-aspartate oxidase